jgi:hypothetical protein
MRITESNRRPRETAEGAIFKHTAGGTVTKREALTNLDLNGIVPDDQHEEEARLTAEGRPHVIVTHRERVNGL